MIRFIYNIKRVIFRITNPSYWIHNHNYIRIWDDRLIDLLNTHNFTDIKRYTAKLGNYTLWIDNYPYGSMTTYSPERGLGKFRASSLTIKRATNKLNRDIILNKAQEY